MLEFESLFPHVCVLICVNILLASLTHISINFSPASLIGFPHLKRVFYVPLLVKPLD